LPGDGRTQSGKKTDADGLSYVKLADQSTWEDRQRPRSYPNSFSLFIGALCLFAMWVSMIGVVVSVTMKYTGHPEPWTRLSFIFLIVLAATLVLGLILSLNRYCPLCHGTPLHSRRCPKHRLAQRWPLLTHRATVVLRILTSLSFRCMYCGTPFRLFKKSSRQK
jgi:hypothetical protein